MLNVSVPAPVPDTGNDIQAESEEEVKFRGLVQSSAIVSCCTFIGLEEALRDRLSEIL